MNSRASVPITLSDYGAEAFRAWLISAALSLRW